MPGACGVSLKGPIEDFDWDHNIHHQSTLLFFQSSLKPGPFVIEPTGTVSTVTISLPTGSSVISGKTF